jgi:4-diphosphocytidyl-2-C-methyl-D-erythritol kinase
MICFPNAKINLGLHITGKRPDGLHSIETVLYPVPLHDALEAVAARSGASFRQTGLKLNSPPGENLVAAACRLIARHRDLPPLEIHLKKAIPPEAGLGGGSADAAFALKLVNRLCNLRITDARLEKMAAAIGSDCPFFIRNTPAIATGTGSTLRPLDLCIGDRVLYIVKPPVSVSTREAYAAVKPRKPDFALETLPSIPVREWKNVLRNDFEPSVFERHPVIREIKDALYARGAEYASLSGSGSAVFGLFTREAPPLSGFPNCFVWKGTPG